MRGRRGLLALAVGALVLAVAGPAVATHQIDPAHPEGIFGVAVVEGPGDISSAPSATVYDQNDPVWRASQPILAAAGQDYGSNPNGGVFFPGFGPPVVSGTSRFVASGINVPDPANPTSQFCASTLGVCNTISIGQIGGYDVPGGAHSGAYCGSSRGHADGFFQADGGGAFDPVSYDYFVDWVQSGATILPLTGKITTGAGTGATIVGFVSARTTSSSSGTCGRPSATTTPGGQTTFVVDGMTVSF